MHPAPAQSPEAQNPAAKPSLLATFHVDKKKEEVTDRLQKLLCRELDLVEDRPRRWRAPDGEEAIMLRFDLRAAPADTTFLQVALNARGDVGEAWRISREKLEKALKPEALEGIWGHTLHYQANLNPGSDPDEAFEKLRRSARLLHSGKGPYTSLAQAEVTGGWMWLLAVPTEGDGSAAGTVYVALNEPEQERHFGKVFFGEGARLLMPELIAHKSYYQRRQYRGERYEQYQGYLKDFRKLVRKLLNELEQREIRSDEVRKLTQRYYNLSDMVWQLEDLRVSIARQLHNYDEWEVTNNNGIFQYHRRHMETSSAELELLVSDGQYALSVADPVLSISRYRAEARQEKEEARDQQLIQTLLLVVATALALPEVIDKDVAGWVIGRITPLEQFEGNAFAELVAQIVLVAILAIPILVGVRLWLNRRRRKVVPPRVSNRNL